MPNTNCLEGMQCPECRSEGPFDIQVICWMEVTDDGTGDLREVEWDSDSACRCMGCNYANTARVFRLEDEAGVLQ